MLTRSIVIYLILLSLPVLISQPIAYWLAQPLAEKRLEQKMSEIKRANVERYDILNKILATQLKQFEFNCGAKDMSLLRNPPFLQHPYSPARIGSWFWAGLLQLGSRYLDYSRPAAW